MKSPIQPLFQCKNCQEHQGKSFPYHFHRTTQPANQSPPIGWRPPQQQPSLVPPPKTPMQNHAQQKPPRSPKILAQPTPNPNNRKPQVILILKISNHIP